jgi:uncharacterized membrane protein YhhN
MTIVIILVSAGLLVALLVAERRQAEWGRIAKMVASTGFVGVAVASGAVESGYGRWVLVALGLSWLGDLLLTFASRRAFLAGLGVFLAAHIGYLEAFVVRGIAWMAAAAAAAVALMVAGGVWRWLAPHLDDMMRRPVAGYVVVISAMVAVAVGTTAHDLDLRILIGAVAFFVSDLAVARNRFVAPGFGNRAWGLPLYYLAQVLLALSTAMV